MLSQERQQIVSDNQHKWKYLSGWMKIQDVGKIYEFTPLSILKIFFSKDNFSFVRIKIGA